MPNDTNDPTTGDSTASTVLACPDCDSTDLRTRSDSRTRGRSDTDGVRWRCNDCQRLVSDPVVRDAQRDGPGAGNKGLAKRLADADPDDVRPDGGLVPDGFDLNEALNRSTSTAADRLKRCPHCHEAHWRPKAKHDHPAGRDREHEERYYCRTCETHIDELLEPGDPDYPEAIPDGGVDLLDVLDEVIVLTGQGGNGQGSRTYHASENCRAVEQSPHGTRPILTDRVPDYWTPCKFCNETAHAASHTDEPHHDSAVDADPDDADGIPLAGDTFRDGGGEHEN